LSFSGRTATAMTVAPPQAGHAARQLLEVIGRSIESPRILPFAAIASQSAAIN
jgi:hypothetical protein